MPKRTYFSSIVVICVLSFCFGCTGSEITTSAGNLTKVQVGAIIDKCGAPESMVVLDNGELTIRHENDVAIFGCVFDALIATGETTLSKVDNQRYDTQKGP